LADALNGVGQFIYKLLSFHKFGVGNMNSKLRLGLIAGFFIAGAGLAHAGGDDAIVARQACMKANGSSMKTFVPMLKGEKPYDAAAIQIEITAMETACAGWKDFWAEDSKTSTTLKTRAADAIWTDAKGFEDANTSYMTAFSALKASKDEASFKAAFPVLGKSCGGCHEKFRSPE
jgi:cytochrome c556